MTKSMSKLQEKLVSSNENNSPDQISIRNKLLLSYYNNILVLEEVEGEELFSSLESILKSKATHKVLKFLCLYKAATVRTIQKVLSEIPPPTVYNALKRLWDMGLVTKVKGKPYKRIMGGPRPRVYAILGYETDDIAKAWERDFLSFLPKDVDVERVTQILIDDYMEPRNDISLIDAGRYLKYIAKDYYSKELREMVIYRLEKVHNKKVWR